MSPAVARAGTSMLFGANSAGGLKLFTAPLASGVPDPGGITIIQTPGEAAYGRWSPLGDSVVYQRLGGVPEAWIIGRDGGGARRVFGPLTFPDWHPTQRRLLGTVRLDSAGIAVSRIVTVDLATGLATSLLTSTTVEHRFPRYSPDGTRIAFLQFPIVGGQAYQLWLADSTAQAAQQLVPGTVEEGYDWSPTGNEITYVQFGYLDFTYLNGTVWKVDITSRLREQVTMNPR